jgi:hypothetical protein
LSDGAAASRDEEGGLIRQDGLVAPGAARWTHEDSSLASEDGRAPSEYGRLAQVDRRLAGEDSPLLLVYGRVARVYDCVIFVEGRVAGVWGCVIFVDGRVARAYGPVTFVYGRRTFVDGRLAGGAGEVEDEEGPRSREDGRLFFADSPLLIAEDAVAGGAGRMIVGGWLVVGWSPCIATVVQVTCANEEGWLLSGARHFPGEEGRLGRDARTMASRARRMTRAPLKEYSHGSESNGVPAVIPASVRGRARRGERGTRASRTDGTFVLNYGSSCSSTR